MEGQNSNDSGGSSPQLRDLEVENPQINRLQPSLKVKFLCSYGGKITPRPHDNKLAYLGGETKILAVDRVVNFGDILAAVNALCNSDCTSFKYQLPGEDLETLISVTNDDDVEHMMHEFDRLCRIIPRSPKMRIFVFLPMIPSDRRASSSKAKSENEMFVEALNTPPLTVVDFQSASPEAAPEHSRSGVGNAEFLFRSEKETAPAANITLQRVTEISGQNENIAGSDPTQEHIQGLKRMKLDEQQVSRSGIEKDSSGEGFNRPESSKTAEIRFTPATLQGGVPFWTDNVAAGVLPPQTINVEQPLYLIPAPGTSYIAPMVRPLKEAQILPAQGYFTTYQMTQPDPEVARNAIAHDSAMGRQVIFVTSPAIAAVTGSGGAYQQAPQMALDSTVGRQAIATSVAVPTAVAKEGGGAYQQTHVTHDSTGERQVIYGTALAGQAAAQYQAQAPTESVGVNNDAVPAVLNTEPAANSAAKLT